MFSDTDSYPSIRRVSLEGNFHSIINPLNLFLWNTCLTSKLWYDWCYVFRLSFFSILAFLFLFSFLIFYFIYFSDNILKKLSTILSFSSCWHQMRRLWSFPVVPEIIIVGHPFLNQRWICCFVLDVLPTIYSKMILVDRIAALFLQ